MNFFDGKKSAKKADFGVFGTFLPFFEKFSKILKFQFFQQFISSAFSPEHYTSSILPKDNKIDPTFATQNAAKMILKIFWWGKWRAEATLGGL